MGLLAYMERKNREYNMMLPSEKARAQENGANLSKKLLLGIGIAGLLTFASSFLIKNKEGRIPMAVGGAVTTVLSAISYENERRKEKQYSTLAGEMEKCEEELGLKPYNGVSA